jgi:hypothetical protein
MSSRRARIGSLVLLIASAIGVSLWAMSTFTVFSLDPRVAQIKLASVSLLQSEARIGEINPRSAASLTALNLSPAETERRIKAHLDSADREYAQIFTPARARWYSQLQAKGLKLWLKEGPKHIVSEQKLNVHYWEQVTVTDFGAWVRVRGQFQTVTNGRTVLQAPATFCLRLVGNPISGYRISNEKWVGYNPS